MKNTILCLLFLLNFIQLNAQEKPYLEIGKQGHWLFDKEVDPFKIGRLRYSLNAFYFRPSNEEEFRKSGWQGRHIISYLEDDDIAMREFKRYKRGRFLTFTSYSISLGATLAWMFRTTDNILSSRGNTIGELLFTEPLAGSLLTTSFLTTIFSDFYQ